MMKDSDLQDISTTLQNARIERVPVAPPSKSWPGLDADSAFEVQKITIANAVSNGDRLVGYKLGNIAKVMQDAFGLDKPDYGFLLGSTFVYEGTQVPLSQFIRPYAELEPAFILSKPLRGPNCTVADVISAVEYAVPSIEIIDSRVKNWEIGLADTLADNGSTGAVILGGTPRRLTELTLNNTRGVMHFNGHEVMAGNTSNILGNPLSAVAWLVNRLAAYDVQLEAGHVVLPGSCLEAVPMSQKGHWSGTFEGWGRVDFEVA